MKLGDLFPEELQRKADKVKKEKKSASGRGKGGNAAPVEDNGKALRKRKFVAELHPGDVVSDFFRITGATLRQAKNGSRYISAGLSDRTGNITARMWDVREGTFESIKDVEYVEANGRVELYSSHNQFIINRIRALDDREVDPGDYLPVSKRDLAELETEFRELVAGIGKLRWRDAVEAVFGDKEFFGAFRLAPAAKEYHHAWLHGLMEHTVSAARTAGSIAAAQPNLDADILVAGTLLHDIGKVFEISSSAGFEYTTQGRLLGHIAMGAMLVDRKCREAGIDDTVRTLLLHMVLAHHGTREFGSPVVPRTREAVALHHIECLDAKVQGASTLFEKNGVTPEKPGWSEYSRMFDGPLYVAPETKDDTETEEG